MNQSGQGIFAPIWGIIGIIMAILDMLDVLQLGLMSFATTACAKTGDVACLNDGIAKMILFAVDVAIGPILLAANLINNFGFLGTLIGLGILYVCYVAGTSNR